MFIKINLIMASRIGVSLPVNLHSHDKVPFIDLRHLPKCWDKWLTATTKVTLQEPRKIPVLTKNCFQENLLNMCSRSQKTVDGLVTNHSPAWILGFDLRSLLGKKQEFACTFWKRVWKVGLHRHMVSLFHIGGMVRWRWATSKVSSLLLL